MPPRSFKGPRRPSRSKKKCQIRYPRSHRRFPEHFKSGAKGPCVDYKDVETLRKMISLNGKILSRKRLGAAAEEQRQIKQAIKLARYAALLPYVGS